MNLLYSIYLFSICKLLLKRKFDLPACLYRFKLVLQQIVDKPRQAIQINEYKNASLHVIKYVLLHMQLKELYVHIL
jgi:hypothetical protein